MNQLTTKSPPLTQEQHTAVNALLEFLADPDPSNVFFTLRGYAGTGKTFCVQEIISRASTSHAKFAFTAPTNKATKVLRAVAGEACTIYALLGLRIDKSGELKQLVAGKEPPDLSEYTAIFIDEGSMISSTLFKLLKVKADIGGIKIVFLGDAAQLPPVGEAESPIWTQVESGASLTTVMRYDNQILKLATDLRNRMTDLCPSVVIKSDHSLDEGVWKMAKQDFKRSIYETASQGGFADGEQSKVIAWRNVRVEEYNHLIRRAIYGATAELHPYLPGDRIVAAGPCLRGDEPLMTTDEEALVESAVACPHPLAPKYQAIELQVRTETNKVVRLLVIHPDSVTKFENDAQELAHKARQEGRLWKKFWEHKELFHEVKHAYALTAHRSQGSTYQNVWVDYQDILMNRNRKEAFQCLYVACTRPVKQLRLA